MIMMTMMIMMMTMVMKMHCNFSCAWIFVGHASVADLGEGPRGPGSPLFVEYLQKIYKKTTEMNIQKPF